MCKHLCWLMTLTFVACGAAVHADDAADKLAAQKKQAEANWMAVEAGESASAETAHFLIYVPKEMEKNLKEIGVNLEKYYAEATKALGYDAKTAPWIGKLTVYLLSEREQFQKFVRRVEKRRLESGETSSHAVEGDLLHVVVGPSQAKEEFPIEAQAGQQIATALLQLKAGPKVPLPEWLLTGFGRATSYRLAPQDRHVLNERKQARDLVVKKNRTAKNVYSGSVDVEEAPALFGALADLFAYGPGAAKFADLLAGYKPTDEKATVRTTEEALDAANLKPERLETAWKAWVANPK